MGLFKTLSERLAEAAEDQGRFSAALTLFLRLGMAALLTAVLVVHQDLAVLTLPYLFGLFALSFGAGALLHQTLKKMPDYEAIGAKAEKVLYICTFLGAGGAQLVVRAHTGEGLPVEFLAFAPLAAQALLAAVIIGAPMSVIGVTVTSLLLGIARVVPVEVLAPAWLCSAAAANLVSPLKRRAHLVRAALILSVLQAGAAVAVASTMYSNGLHIAESAVWGAVAAIIAASVFWLGTAFMEKLVGITSDWTLLELTGPDHPLLRELVMRAPGTYAHSVMVANLSEAAARDIGANPIACRAMALFHDIGKTERPNSFIENQTGHNPHDDLAPRVSSKIIRGHVTHGVVLAKEHKLPDILIDGITQHHGTSVIAWFLHKELERCPDAHSKDIESDFRYAGPKPQSREAAILHLADMVEAASRTAKPETKFEDLIDSIVEATQRDGQLDECELTFRDLLETKRAFAQVLSAMRHDRIEYPEKEEEQPAENESDDHDSEQLEKANSN
jgi:putative nucleotidyltransferase with HDIG domain